jgi:hypothetical protein
MARCPKKVNRLQTPKIYVALQHRRRHNSAAAAFSEAADHKGLQ